MPKTTDDSRMPFGKFKGTALKEVPPDYLIWLYEKMLDDNDTVSLFRYLQQNEAALRSEIESEKSGNGS